MIGAYSTVSFGRGANFGVITMQDERTALASVAGHFQLPLDSADIDEIVAGPAFTRHSKSGAAYSPDARRDDYAAARGAYGEEIAQVLAWAEKVAELANLSLEGPNPLV